MFLYQKRSIVVKILTYLVTNRTSITFFLVDIYYKEIDFMDYVVVKQKNNGDFIIFLTI